MHLIQKLYIYLFNHEVNKHEKITRLCVDKKMFFLKTDSCEAPAGKQRNALNMFFRKMYREQRFNKI